MRVVAVGPVERPSDREARLVREDRPLVTELGSIRRGLARSLASTWAFVERSVESCVGQIEAHNLVAARQRLVHDRVEDSCGDPLVAPLARSRIGDLPPAQPLRVLPRAARGEDGEHDLEALPVRFPQSMPTEGMAIDEHGDEGFDRLPDNGFHFRVERAHDREDLLQLSGMAAPDM